MRKYHAERFIRSLEFDTVGFRGFSFAFIGQFASKVAEYFRLFGSIGRVPLKKSLANMPVDTYIYHYDII